jgi:hypothetical protein
MQADFGVGGPGLMSDINVLGADAVIRIDALAEIARAKKSAAEAGAQWFDDWMAMLTDEHKRGEHAERTYLSCPDCLIAVAFTRGKQ